MTPGIFDWSITIWLFLTVIFANFAEAMAEGRGKAQADTLRKMRSETEARRLNADGVEERVSGSALRNGDLVVCEANDLIPSDGEIVEGIASVDESAITGESAPVIRESGGDRSAVTGGTKVLSDRIVVRITAEPGHTFIDRMIALVEGANRQKTPNEIALTILLAVLTIIFLPVVRDPRALRRLRRHARCRSSSSSRCSSASSRRRSGRSSAIGIAGMDRLVQRNVLAMSGRAVEAAGDTQTLLLDKTGTITLGNRMASTSSPVGGHTRAGRRRGRPSSPRSPTRRPKVGPSSCSPRSGSTSASATSAPSTPSCRSPPSTRMSGLDIGTRQIRKGAGDSVKHWVEGLGGTVPRDLDPSSTASRAAGSTPLVVADGTDVVGVIELKDIVKQGIRERFAEMRPWASAPS